MTKKINKPAKGSSFWRKLLINLCCMLAVGFVIGWIALIWLDVWTDHGSEVTTPSVKGMPYSVAAATLASQGFGCELIDSVYDTTRPPGTVTEQSPKEGSMVKTGREIYLTITAVNPKMVSLPKVTDVSERQARAMLAGVGIKSISTVSVPSDYKDLVVGLRVDGSRVSAGTRVPVTSHVVIEVGSGPVAAEPDTMAIDASAAVSDESYDF